MDLKSNFKESLMYPIRKYKKFILLGTLFIILDINTLVFLNSDNPILTIFCIIDSIILLIIIMGDLISIIQETRLTTNEFEFGWWEKFGIGVKGFLISSFGIAIPLILFLLITYITGTGEYYFDILEVGVNGLTINLSVMFNDYSFIVLLINLFIVLLFIYFTVIALARLSHTNNLLESVNIKKIIEDLKNIGIIHFTLWVLIMFILMIIMGIVCDKVYYISYVGLIISSYILVPYITMFLFKSIGNEYSI